MRFMTMLVKQILARTVGIQKDKLGGKDAFFRDN